MVLPDFGRSAIPIASQLVTATYDQHRGMLSSFMEGSLRLRHDPAGLLDLQAEMANALLSLQENQRKLEAEKDTEDEDRELEHKVGICKRLQLIIRHIADGIAWRSLNYDRMSIQQLVLKPQTGHIQRETAIQEFTEAGRHLLKTGELIIMNDLTNFLRYGDFTSVGPRGITIHEVKAGVGAAKSGHSQRQKRKLAQVMEFLAAGERRTSEGLQRLVRYKSEPRAHLNDLRDLVATARNKGSAHARLSDCLAADVILIEEMAERLNAGKKSPIHNPFEQSRDSTVFHSLQWFSRFARNLAPYSLFPLPVEDRMDIMTGAVWVVTYFNWGNLLRCLRRRDLLAKLPDRSETARNADFLPGQVAKHELDSPLVVARRRNGPTQLISLAALARVFVEFLDEESFADTVEEKLDSAAPQEEVLMFNAFESEHELWD